MIKTNKIQKLFFFQLIIFALFFRLLIILISDYNQNVFFIGDDAWGMHIAGLDVSTWDKIDFFDQNKIPYISFIAVIYKYIYPSYLLSALCSLIVWLLSLYVLIKILNLLKINKNIIFAALIIYCFLPTSIIYTSSTIREPYQLLVTNLFLLCLVNIYLSNNYFKILYNFSTIIFLSFIFYMLHRIGPIFGIINLLIALFIIFSKFKFKKVYFLNIFLFVSLLIFFTINFISYFTYNFSFEQFQKGYIKAIQIYQNGLFLSSPNSRATYFQLHNFENYFDIIKFILIAFLKYNLEPILSPQKINTKDIVLIFENLVRSSIYIVIFVFSFNINNLKNNIYVAILLVLLFTEMVWSLGTNNWGTASRHHIPSAGIILICISIILNGKFNEKK